MHIEFNYLPKIVLFKKKCYYPIFFKKIALFLLFWDIYNKFSKDRKSSKAIIITWQIFERPPLYYLLKTLKKIFIWRASPQGNGLWSLYFYGSISLTKNDVRFFFFSSGSLSGVHVSSDKWKGIEISQVIDWWRKLHAIAGTTHKDVRNRKETISLSHQQKIQGNFFSKFERRQFQRKQPSFLAFITSTNRLLISCTLTFSRKNLIGKINYNWVIRF